MLNGVMQNGVMQDWTLRKRRMRKRETRSMRRPFIAISYLSARRWGCAGTIASTRWNPTACRTIR